MIVDIIRHTDRLIGNLKAVYVIAKWREEIITEFKENVMKPPLQWTEQIPDADIAEDFYAFVKLIPDTSYIPEVETDDALVEVRWYRNDALFSAIFVGNSKIHLILTSPEMIDLKKGWTVKISDEQEIRDIMNLPYIRAQIENVSVAE